ncbi:microtubule-associated tumor suppressor 1 homolog isoform X1 [Nerophis ophidion]|uniref:microtubule-associated tumor suppressor 1 homolog isoform X1 n=2 Tax=Nerophis ophidion TaxID=159077 RepID=UPI002ADFFB1A|nr:microtubule-associated tumor suppressor 1 homolog isoform X1 [Nerophis ophidion]XP_061763278.1 microtubule-associated tumor suppressor 1 homolog isoform X1 [Nerophis ophidion]
MSVSKPGESVTDVKKRKTSMRLPLQSTGDYNGNAFPVFSSSSSSSSCLGESPESVRSRSSINSGCAVSPHNNGSLQVTLATTLMTKTEGIVEDALQHSLNRSQFAENDISFEKMQTATDLSDSNDNSISVYLDASAHEHQETWQDYGSFALSLALTSSTVGCNHNNRLGSSTPDSEATEILADYDDDDCEDEALFLSLNSETGAQRTIVTLTDTSKPSLFSRGNLAQTPPTEAMSVDHTPVSGMLLPDKQDTLHITSEDSGTSCKSCLTPSAICPVQDAKDFAPLSNIAENLVMAPKLLCCHQGSTNPKTTTLEISNHVEKRLPKRDFKNIKAKIDSQPTHSPLKTIGQSKSVSTFGRKMLPRKDEVEVCNGDKRSAGTVRVAAGLKPIQGLCANVKSSHKTMLRDSTKSKRQSGTIRRIPSDYPSVLDSQVTEKKHSPRPGKDAQEVSDNHEVNVESTHTKELPGEKCVVQTPPAAGNADKPGNHTLNVSKLGPVARQQGQSTRGVRVPPPATRPPDPDGLGSRQALTDGPVGREVGRSAGDGSPMRVKHFQSPALSKPRNATPSPSNPNSKSRVSPQPPGARPASKLPVKGVLPSLSSSLMGCKENNKSTCKASLTSTCSPVSTEERPGRCSAPATSSLSGPTSCNTGINLNNIAASKAPALRNRALSTQSKTASGVKIPSVNNYNGTKAVTSNGTTEKIPSTVRQELTKQTSSPLQRSGSARLGRIHGTVDKKPRDVPARYTAAGKNNQNKQTPPPDLVPVTPVAVSDSTNTELGTAAPTVLGCKIRTGSRGSPKHGARSQSTPKPGVAGAMLAKQDLIKEDVDKKQSISFRKVLLQANKGVEALATVIQHLFLEREEVLKEKKDLSKALESLRSELVASSQCCERLHKEKEEVRVNLEEALKELDQSHKEELVQLEDRLRSFYQTEWDKVHKTYQEEADKYRMLMEQQVEELRTRHEAERKTQETRHSQTIESIKQQHETSVQEFKDIEKTNRENLEKTLKKTETTLSDKVNLLSAENEALNEKLKTETDRRRRILTDKNLRDSHTVYLEQELESLKVVLELKNSQLHQKEKKLMEMHKLVETNVKMEECLRKVQQENEDYRARMDKHAALSKQLSSEQAKLQQTLQKESKVNKRLSMENEELLWKLHNGDLLASPRRLSPTSPCGSPQSSASFAAAAPLSPR